MSGTGSINGSVTINIHHMLDELPPTSSKPSIYKVDSHLRSSGSNDIYEPEKLSIGPYHHGASRLQNMEPHKYMYLKRLLKRINEQKVDRFVDVVGKLEKRARGCYAEPLDHLDENALVTLMVLDGFFLIELFRYYSFKWLRDIDDPIFKHERILSQLRHDILLLENQLPFFVMNQLFVMTKTNENPDDDLSTLALRFFHGTFLNLPISQVSEVLSVKNIDHLCGLIHDAWCLPLAMTISHNKMDEKWDNINPISDLRVAGIKFKKANVNCNLMDIKVVNNELSIPRLSISDETESQFRNLIAYEQYLPDGDPRYVSDYTFVMHCLINTSNDVELLRRRGIIENWLGNDEEACLMFNRLGKNILTSTDFSYSQVFCTVNKQCSRRANKWKANLRRNYFNNPWSIISFIAAVALLLLTFTQTTYTVLSYYNRKV